MPHWQGVVRHDSDSDVSTEDMGLDLLGTDNRSGYFMRSGLSIS